MTTDIRFDHDNPFRICDHTSLCSSFTVQLLPKAEEESETSFLKNVPLWKTEQQSSRTAM